jgi:hypothetical protein
MNDPTVYPIARDFIPYRSPIRLEGLHAWPCTAEEANAEALDSSYNGTTLGYAEGQTMRARYLPEKL